MLWLMLIAMMTSEVSAADLQCPSIANFLIQMPTDAASQEALDPVIAQGCRVGEAAIRDVVGIDIQHAVGVGPTYFLAPSLSMSLQSPFTDKLVILQRDLVTVRTEGDEGLPVGTQARTQLQRCLQTRRFLQSLGLPAGVCSLSEE